MKKILLILSLMVTGLTGCYVAPHRDHDDGYRNERDRRDDGDHRRDRDGEHRDRDGYR